MALFVGLDVSLKATSICIVEANGKLIWEGSLTSFELRTRRHVSLNAVHKPYGGERSLPVPQAPAATIATRMGGDAEGGSGARPAWPRARA